MLRAICKVCKKMQALVDGRQHCVIADRGSGAGFDFRTGIVFE